MRPELNPQEKNSDISDEGFETASLELSEENARLKEELRHLSAAFDDVVSIIDCAAIPTLVLTADLKLRRYTAAASQLLGLNADDVGRDISLVDSELINESLAEDWAAVIDNEGSRTSELISEGRWFQRRVTAFRRSDGSVEGVVIVFQDITEIRKLSHRAESRERQHSAVARLGELALKGEEPETLIDEAVEAVASVLEVDYCKALRYEPESGTLLLISGVGWKEGLVGEARVPDDIGSQAGYTLLSREPVIVESLPDEQRFAGPQLLIDHGVISGISCVIEGKDFPYGVFAVHTREPRHFTPDDANFLVSVANMLSNAIQAKQAQETIYNSEAQFRTIANSIPQLAWMADETGYIFWYNDRWYEYTGTTLEEMKGWGWQKVHRQDLVEEITDKYRRHIESGEEWEDTFPILGKSGEFRWFLSRAKPIRDKQGRIIRWFGTNTDVTERLEYEEALRESEERLHIALEANRCGYFEYEIKSGELEWDDFLKDVWGVREEEATTYEIFLEGLHPDDIVKTEKAIRSSLAADGDGHYNTIYRVINRITGEMTWIEASGQVFFHDGEPVKMIGMVTDITEKKQAEQAKELLSSIVESSNDAIVSKDLNSMISSWNRGAEKLFGYSADEVIGKPITIVIPEDRLDEEDLIMSRLREGRKIEHFETVRKRKDGSLIDISVTISPIRDSEGRITGASKVARDISERKRLENSLRDAVSKLQAADEKKNEFLAILGHELRNPLSALRGSVEIIEQGFDRPDELARIMQSSIETMSKLLDDLLDLSRVSQDRIALDRETVDLEEVIKAAVAAARNRYKEKEQEILAAISGPLFTEGDATRLEQIFSNLLSNACRYSGTKSEIVVRAEKVGEEAVVVISDEGIGMDSDVLEKVFDPFYQVKPDGQAASGLGIGLALAKKLVDLHGGSIRASSEGSGLGSQFEVRLPATDAPEFSVSQEIRERKVSLPPNLEIVLVEDNEDILITSAILLEGLGCRVAKARTANEGLTMIREMSPDAALIDIGLPDSSGYEIAETLRAEGYSGLLVAVSGYSHEEARERSREAGFDHHIAKPARTSEIAEILSMAKD